MVGWIVVGYFGFGIVLTVGTQFVMARNDRRRGVIVGTAGDPLLGLATLFVWPVAILVFFGVFVSELAAWLGEWRGGR